VIGKPLVLAVVAACGHVAPAAPAAEPAKSLQINRPGERVDLATHLVAGYVTVVDFWGAHCGACEVVGGMLAIGVARDPRIVIRKIDVGDGFTPVAQAYAINALPHYRIYDKHRRLRYDLVGNDCVRASELSRALADER
jgi:thiol-disulfide isomerase/thioredoxin